MCLLINQTRKNGTIKPIDKQSMRTAFDSNPDGAGFAYGVGHRVEVRKYRKFKSFYKAYLNAIELNNDKSDLIVHFRYKTHGLDKNLFNVHPFKVNDKLAFAHNGIIQKVDNDKKLSDPQVFNRDFLKRLNLKQTINTPLSTLIESYIGGGNKLAFVNAKGHSIIINESAGHWNGSNWFSNYSYESYGSCYANPLAGEMSGGFNFTYRKPIKTQSHKLCHTCNKYKPANEVSAVNYSNTWYNECFDCIDYYKQQMEDNNDAFEL